MPQRGKSCIWFLDLDSENTNPGHRSQERAVLFKYDFMLYDTNESKNKQIKRQSPQEFGVFQMNNYKKEKDKAISELFKGMS